MTTNLLDRMKKNMLVFGKICFPAMFSLPTPAFHKTIAKVLQDPNNRKVNIIAPRGHAKSSLVAGVFVLWHLFLTPGPHMVVLVSKTSGHAERLLETIKNILEYSTTFRALFGYHGVGVAKRWTNTEIVLDNNDMIVTRGMGMQVVGLKHDNQRPTLVVLDDPEDLNNTKTVEAMEMNQKWLFTQLIPTMDAHRGQCVVIGTPQHESCLVETLEKAKDWKSLRFKAIQDDNTALWPEMWSVERLLNEKQSLESINKVSWFYREYQCQIIGDEDQLFKPHYLQRYRGHLIKNQVGYEHILVVTHRDGTALKEPERIPVLVFMGIDPASSTRQSADYSVIMPVAVDAQARRYLLPHFRAHVSPLKLAEKILDWFEAYRPIKTRVESTGYQEMLREYLREVSAKRNIYIPGLEIKETPRQNKSVRLEALEPFFASRQVWLLETSQDVENELLSYPRGKHDDILDALYYAMKGNYKPWHNLEDVDKAQRRSSEEEMEREEDNRLVSVEEDDGPWGGESGQFEGFIGL